MPKSRQVTTRKTLEENKEESPALKRELQLLAEAEKELLAMGEKFAGPLRLSQ